MESKTNESLQKPRQRGQKGSMLDLTSNPDNQVDDSYNVWRLQHLRLGSPCRSKASIPKPSAVSPDESGNWWDGLDSSSGTPWSRRTPVLPSKFVPKSKFMPQANTLFNFERNSESPLDLDNVSSWSAPVISPNTTSWYRPRAPSPPRTQSQSQFCCCATVTRCHNPAMSFCNPSVLRASSTPTPPSLEEEARRSQFNVMTFLQGMYYLSVVGLLGFNVLLFWVIQSSPNRIQFLSTEN